MDNKHFSEIITNNTALTPKDRSDLEALSSLYPYSSAVMLASLSADYCYGFSTQEQQQRVAKQVFGKDTVSHCLTQALQKSAEREPSFDILTEINNYKEMSFKTVPRSEILSKFLNIDDSGRLQEDLTEEENTEKEPSSSVQDNMVVGTETLAFILQQQGKYQQALAIYKNLLRQNPEKSVTFAAQIEHLEQLIANSQQTK